MKSPEMQNLDSPELSGESAFGDDDEDTDVPTSPEVSHRAPNVIVRRPTAELDEREGSDNKPAPSP
jgi:hypothetical protein